MLDYKPFLSDIDTMSEDIEIKENFLQRLFSIFKSKDPEAEKKRVLKAINKELSKTKTKFYKYNSSEALPQMAKFFYDIYKITGQAQILFQKNANPNAYKNMVIDFFLTDKQKVLSEALHEEAILEKSKKTDLKSLYTETKKNLQSYISEFDHDKITKIDALYAKISALIAFCTFDYYFLLKKFDSQMEEYNFSYVPKFEYIRAEYIVDDLKDFTSIAWGMPLDDDWTDVFDLLKEYRNSQPIAINLWNKLLQRLRKYRDNGIFEMIIQLITKKPDYTCLVTTKSVGIIDEHFNKIKQDAEKIIQGLQTQQKNSQISSLLTIIFGTTNVTKLKYYSESGNNAFAKRSLPGYAYHEPLNYLKAFLVDYYKKYVREFSDLVLVRGQWMSAVLSAPMSEAYHGLLNISDQITRFDSTLSDETDLGLKLKTYTMRGERDPEAKKILQSVLRDINSEAHKILRTAIKDLITLAKTTKNLIEDMDKKKPEMLINWAEISHYAEPPIKEQGLSVYKHIFHFISLMKYYLGNSEQ